MNDFPNPTRPDGVPYNESVRVAMKCKHDAWLAAQAIGTTSGARAHRLPLLPQLPSYASVVRTAGYDPERSFGLYRITQLANETLGLLSDVMGHVSMAKARVQSKLTEEFATVVNGGRQRDRVPSG